MPQKTAKQKAATKKAATKAKEEKEALEMTDEIWTELGTAFDEKEDDLASWKPDEVGESVFGQISEFGMAVKHKTPYLTLVEPDGANIIVFIKSALQQMFARKRWLNKDGAWEEAAVKEHGNELIAIRYDGEKVNPATKRKFQAYKVLFQDELPEAALAVYGA